MKYIVILGDGMADHPVQELGWLTPLEVAKKPNMDFIAQNGRCGMVRTVPDGMAAGSDTANLSVFGYDPRVYYSGRSPLEAVSMGITLSGDDLAYRCNLVCLSDAENYEDASMIDYSAEEISTEEARELITALAHMWETSEIELYAGISYRHCLVLRDGVAGAELIPPHDITGKPIGEYLPKRQNAALLLSMMKESRELLRTHPVNINRMRRGLKPATSVWFWGEGRRPSLPSFYDKYNKRGAVISAVDLIKGIGTCAGMRRIEVSGATGNLHTNFSGKAEAALEALLSCQFVYLHVEAPDECGHQGDVTGKVQAIELIDQKIIAPIMKGLEQRGEDYSILVMPDHPTPLHIKTHTAEAVPFAFYRTTGIVPSNVLRYDEKNGTSTGDYIDKGHTLMDQFIND